MGKKMDKQDVIYGGDGSVLLTNVNFDTIANLVKNTCGRQPDLTHARQAVAEANADKKFQGGYVKVGKVDGVLVLRCKKTSMLGDCEKDAVIFSNWAGLLAQRSQVVAQARADAARLKKEQDELAERQANLAEVHRELKRKALIERGERLARLAAVMRKPDANGETLRDRMKRAVTKAHTLGMTERAKTTVKQQGLRRMHEDYAGEVMDHTKHRYGLFLDALKGTWQQNASKQYDFSSWLDKVELQDDRVPGVSETHTIFDEYVSSGGSVTYLSDETRRAYEVKASKGDVYGSQIIQGKNAIYIFVIGPDDKLYVSMKERAGIGAKGAFNHSSFFSGAAVKSAGMIHVEGGKITNVIQSSGHYRPDAAMTKIACAHFFSNDLAAMQQALVQDPGRSVEYASVFMGVETEDEVVLAILQQHPAYHGAMNDDAAEHLGQNLPLNNWFLRWGPRGFTMTHNTGSAVMHYTRQEKTAYGFVNDVYDFLPTHAYVAARSN